MTVINVAYDMDTGDPDDTIALLYLLAEKKVNLRLITVYPGSKNQIGLIKHILEILDKKDILVGSFKQEDSKSYVSSVLSKMYGNFKPAEPDGIGYELLVDFYKKNSNGLFINTAPLGNLYKLLKSKAIKKIPRIFVQSGFAGANCIPVEKQIRKFKGLYEYPAYNFNGFIKGAWEFLNTHIIEKKFLISKDVTHRIIYDNQLHEKILKVKKEKPEYNLMWNAMEVYLKRKPEGKRLHDPLTACAALNPDIITFKEVKCYNHGTNWGSYEAKNTNIFISVDVDVKKFLKTFINDN